MIPPPRFTDKVKAFTLTAVGYPSVDGFTKRTYLIEYEEIDELLCEETQG